MTKRSVWIAALLIAAGIPPALLANSGTLAAAPAPPLKRTGAAVDGGLTCTACHVGNAVNSGSGSLVIRASSYTPGVKQTVEVQLSDPDAQRWGFQLIARLVSDETKQAGTFSTSADVQVRCEDGVVIGGQMRGAPAPCAAGVLQFASHTMIGTQRGTTGSRTFRVEWTPPSSDLGPVMFYAAGNAANSSGNPQGDRIYNTGAPAASAGCTLTGTPAVTGIGNAAGSTAINSNSLISIYGSNFFSTGNTLLASVHDLDRGKLPTSLACVAVEVGGQRAPLYYIQGNQINAQAPILNAVGPVPVRVILNPGTPAEIRSAEAAAQVAVYSPAFFTFNGASIAALTADFKILADPAVVASGVFAKPGDTVILYGTGFGYTNPVYQAGEFADGLAPLRDPFTVTVGGSQIPAANILYAGLASDAPGFYQFNIKLPDTVGDGNVPVSITIGGVSTQTGATIPVSR